eukprot:scaffold1365_cov121-Isochrysis_galbana.AAC.10
MNTKSSLGPRLGELRLAQQVDGLVLHILAGNCQPLDGRVDRTGADCDERGAPSFPGEGRDGAAQHLGVGA